MSSVQQLCDGALAAMGRSDEGALQRRPDVAARALGV